MPLCKKMFKYEIFDIFSQELLISKKNKSEGKVSIKSWVKSKPQRNGKEQSNDLLKKAIST